MNPFLSKLIDIIWPWVAKHILPILKDKILEIAQECIAWLAQGITDLFTSRSSTREREAEENAQTAEQKVNSASSEAEANEYRAIAKVWREVAEQHRRDIQDLKSRISQLEAETQLDIQREVKEIYPVVGKDALSGKPTITIGGETKNLPTLK